MELKLNIISRDINSGEPIQLSLKGKEFVLGRLEADIMISDPLCSKKHALLYEDSEYHLCLEDLASRNGTYVSARRIKKTNLKIGDTFKIGDTEITVVDFKSKLSIKSPPHAILQKEENQLFDAMPEEQREFFLKYISAEKPKAPSQLNELLKRFRK